MMMDNPSTSDPRSTLGLSLSDAHVRAYLSGLSALVGSEKALEPDVKSYSDVIYANYYLLGVSFMLVAKDGSKALKGVDAYSERLLVDSIDVYNTQSQSDPKADDITKPASSTTSRDFSRYPGPEIEVQVSQSKEGSVSVTTRLTVTNASMGKDFVSVLEEPDRKGGGAGPAHGSIGIWCEWKRNGIMIEFGGSEARGPQAWERGKDAVWKVLTFFRPS